MKHRRIRLWKMCGFPKYLQGDSVVSIPLEEDEAMHIGYILNKDKELSELGEIYVEALKQYQI